VELLRKKTKIQENKSKELTQEKLDVTNYPED